MKVLIVGGVAGGATAAARIRRLDESAEIIILERSGFISYANCGLPYYIGGVIESKQALTLQTPESFWQRFHIEVRVKNEVTEILPNSKKIKVKNLVDGTEYEETYDKLILSPGARAIRPAFPGIDDDRIMTLRTVEDTYYIREYLEKNKPERAVVIGGGFIGLEMAENLMHTGIDTVMLQRENQVMQPLDYDMACEVHSYLRAQGLDLRLNETVKGFSKSNDKVGVLLENGDSVEADMVILAIGVAPESTLAKAAGLKLGARDAISVNEKMETSEPDIYAVGDAVEIKNLVTGEKGLISLAGPANKQGRIAADQICGINSSFKGAQGSSILKLFDMTIATTGINERAAMENHISYDKTVTYSASHAVYYPGAANMTIKTIYAPEDGKILGAQIVGFDGVDKRIDVLATALRANMKAEELEELDLAYAPPYSSAKDPVNMAGYVIGNLRSGLVKQYHWHELEEIKENADNTILDVRTKNEFSLGRIPGAVNIPVDELREHIQELDKTKKIYVNCYSGLRSYIACRILTQAGYDCYNLSGGYRFYEYIAGDKNYDSNARHLCGIEIEK